MRRMIAGISPIAPKLTPAAKPGMPLYAVGGLTPNNRPCRLSDRSDSGQLLSDKNSAQSDSVFQAIFPRSGIMQKTAS
jgi:hypothetical protein